MSKKKKKKSDGPKPFLSKKKKRLITRLVMIGGISYAAYAFYNPDIIADEAIKGQVIGAKEQLYDINNTIQNDFGSKLTSLDPSVINEKLPQGAVLGDKEVRVEDAITTITSQVKKLPEDQVRKLKADFCADVIQEATKSANN